MTYLLRVVLPDRPGTLGSLASALGAEGADILSVDVVERGAGSAVDDLVVDMPSSRPPDVLITAAEAVHGVIVESVRPFAGALDTTRELELVEAVAAHPEEGVRLLAEGVPGLFRSAWALVTETTGEGQGVRRVASSPAAPETEAAELSWLPLDKATVLDPIGGHTVPEAWTDLDTELAAAPVGRPERALVVGRPGGPAFRPSELARLSHLCGIVATIVG
ncbi:amino acid-binding protein [Actinomycetospora sp. NBRC 106375]|uniref:ACT domain-containing protein n=1 Tax=Actinomycetospora sp. NBRC 106375 TaxID=3032207 RepID=UPI0024A07855|nr:ACT domain-containing protein [Actinomycetospora sp. NBRC 106375]GLZ47901.1 amino acid-binding protein [Actinomycetospora sp. NBRC 106375]